MWASSDYGVENRAHPPELSIELPIFLQNALILFVRESRLGMGLSICRSIIEADGGTDVGRHTMWDRVRGMIPIAIASEG